MAEERTVLIVGGLVVGAVVLFAVLKQAQRNSDAALNQPGLLSQPSIPAPGASDWIGAAVGGVSSLLQNAWDSGSSGLNDPGLEGSSQIDYGSPDYTASNSSNYSSSYVSPFESANTAPVDYGYTDPSVYAND